MHNPNPIPDDVPSSTLARYVAGEMSAEDARRLEEWARGSPERAQRLDEARRLWAAVGPTISWDAEHALDVIKQRAKRERVVKEVRAPIVPARRSWAVPAAVAAGFGLIAALLWGLERSKPRGDVAEPPRMAELVTKRGQRAELRLPEGSRVILGVDSRLRYPERVGAGPRLVELDGEAYFEVQHDPQRPFEVRAGEARIRDLGTSFVVRSRPAQPTEVVVAQGMVTLSHSAHPGDSVLLSRDDRGRLSPDGRLERTRGVELANYLGWTEGRLVFVDTPLRDVVTSLSRWYNLDIRLQDSSLANLPLTASFTNEPVGQVLDLIASSLKVRYQPQGSSIRIYSRGR